MFRFGLIQLTVAHSNDINFNILLELTLAKVHAQTKENLLLEAKVRTLQETIDQLQTDYEEAKNILAKQSVSKTTKPKQINKLKLAYIHGQPQFQTRINRLLPKTAG